jgi:hypothetical protein
LSLSGAGFAWGTVQMKSAKQRNNLIEHAKKKPFKVGSDHFQVKRKDPKKG